MALSTGAKTAVWVLLATVLLGGAFVGYRLLTKQEGEPLLAFPGIARPATCPLTGDEPDGESSLDRRAIAVKVENLPQARPQAGLNDADVVYEQEAEGGITRFNVLYHCADSDRVGPIRSARPVDPLVLSQFGDVLFIHAGSVQAVTNRVEEAGIEDVNCNTANCPRDEEKSPPHDIFMSTDDLRDMGEAGDDPPPALFRYGEETPEGARRGREVHLNFSPAADVTWTYRRGRDHYVRFHDETPHETEEGAPVSATNVVVQIVERELTQLTDSAGNPVPTFELVGRGDAYVFRNGRVIRGTWERASSDEPTTFMDADGEEIPLAPGRTWVELFPTDAPEPIEF